MNDESILREKARKAILAGTLPNRRPDRTWGGPGIGVDADCPICGAPVKHDQTEFEIEFTGDDDDAGPGTYHLHIRCFAAWELERRNLARIDRQISTSRQARSAMAGGQLEEDGTLP